MIFLQNKFFFRLVEFVGDDDPCSRSVSAVHFGTGHVFAVVGVGFVIDGEVDPGDRLRCRDYFNRHGWVKLGGRGGLVFFVNLRGVLESSELMSRVFYNSITQVSTTGVSASDTRSGDRVGSDARSRTKAMRTQATSARASWNGDKRIVLSCPRIDKLAT